MSKTDLQLDGIERLGFSPNKRYVLVCLNTSMPPGCALTKRGEYDSLDEIIVPPATEQMAYVVYDQDGNTYSREDI